MKMELWIRSQDRTFLRKVNTIGIVEGRDFWSIDENLTVSFGKYKTKERALEVLTEIQNMLYAGLKATNNNQLAGTTTIVYQMPEK